MEQASQPSPRRRVPLAVLGWFLALALFLFLLQWAVHTASRHFRIKQAAGELAQMQRMLEEFKARNGRYPLVSRNSVLLKCFLGRGNVLGFTFTEPQTWYLNRVVLYFRGPDPTVDGNEIIDPWGEPYAYSFVVPPEGGPVGYVIVSSGPDRKRTDLASWLPAGQSDAPEDRDNLVVRSR